MEKWLGMEYPTTVDFYKESVKKSGYSLEEMQNYYKHTKNQQEKAYEEALEKERINLLENLLEKVGQGINNTKYTYTTSHLIDKGFPKPLLRKFFKDISNTLQEEGYEVTFNDAYGVNFSPKEDNKNRGNVQITVSLPN